MKLPNIALLLSSSSTLVVVSSETVPANPQECIDPADFPEDTDYFPDKYTPHSTTDFLTIDYFNTYKIVTNKFNDKSYLLYQCGTEPPESESGKHHVVLPIPHEGGVAITQTTHIAPMELLNKRSDIKAYIGNPQLVSSPCLNHLIDEETVDVMFNADNPYDSEFNKQSALDFVTANPDAVVFAGPTGNKDEDSHLAIAASQEKTAVASFDWLGMYAALFNLEGMANEIISDTEARYECSAKNAKALVADIQEADKPKILWAQYFDGIGWSVADCPTPDEAYYCEFANHCGAEIISRPEGMGFSKQYGSPTVYWYLEDEDFLKLGKDAETWIYPSKTFSDVYAEKKELLDQFKSVQNENVYDTQGQGPNGWHEQRLAEYDIVALDMCALVGTNNPETIHRRRWFRSYFDENIGSAGTCDVPDELEVAWKPAEAQCTPLRSAAEAKPDETEDLSDETEVVSDETEPTIESANAATFIRGVELAVVTVAASVLTLFIE